MSTANLATSSLMSPGELRERLISLSQQEAIEGMMAVASIGAATTLALAAFRSQDQPDARALSRQADTFSFAVRHTADLGALHGYGSVLAMSDVGYKARTLSARLLTDLKALSNAALDSPSAIHPEAETEVEGLMATVAAMLPDTPKVNQKDSG